MNVCYLVITGLILSTEKGEVKLSTFLDDRAMHSLYEKFILEYYRYHHPEYKATLALIKYIADEDKLEKVLENPQVIKTPVVRNGKQSTLGYQPDVWKGWN